MKKRNCTENCFIPRESIIIQDTIRHIYTTGNVGWRWNSWYVGELTWQVWHNSLPPYQTQKCVSKCAANSCLQILMIASTCFNTLQSFQPFKKTFHLPEKFSCFFPISKYDKSLITCDVLIQLSQSYRYLGCEYLLAISISHCDDEAWTSFSKL